MSKEGLLTNEQAFNPTGCGGGTEKACFALSAGPGGMQCLLITNPNIANIAGIKLGWRVNVDEEDNKAWCPLGVLNISKQG
jgi:hypothetical protein